MTPAFGGLTLLVAVFAAARGTWSPCGLSMVSAINPLAERGRGNRYWLTVVWFVAGSVAGGALLGAAIAVPALIGRLAAGHPLTPGPAAALLGSLGCLLALAADRRVGGFSLPIHPRQVNERWLMQYRRWLYAAGFGFQIGTGFATYIMTAATYLVVLLGLLSGSAGFAMLTGIGFGLVRGSAVLLSSRSRSPQALQALHRQLHRWEPRSLRVLVVVELATAAGFGYRWTGWIGSVIALALGAALLAAGRLGKRVEQPGSPNGGKSDILNTPVLAPAVRP